MGQDTGAPIASPSEFETWWKERLALRSFPIPDDAMPFAEGYARAAWDAGAQEGVRRAYASMPQAEGILSNLASFDTGPESCGVTTSCENASHPGDGQATCMKPKGHPGNHAGVVEW